MGTKSKSTHIW